MARFRLLPVLIIEGTSFLVDIDKQVLRQTNNLSNEISFIDHMHDYGNRYRLVYDLDKKTVAGDLRNVERFKIIDIPTLAQLAPEELSEKYGIDMNELKGKSDFEITVNQEALELRHQGVLPRISLLDEQFVVDLRLYELRHARNFHPVISLRSFHLTLDRNHYEGFYHTSFKQPVLIDHLLTEFPDNVVKLRVPNDFGLDPVGAARARGLDERIVLRHYPIQLDLKAEVIPLSETYIPGLIRQNRQQLKDEHKNIRRRNRLQSRRGL